MLAPKSAESWLHFITTDAQVIGLVTWLGLLVTIIGFVVALAQIAKVKKSSTAANDAVAKLAGRPSSLLAS